GAGTGSSGPRAKGFAPVATGWSKPRPARSRRPSSIASRRSCGCGSPCTSRTRRSQRPLPVSGSPSSATANTMAEALVALGGNIGDVRDTLNRAIAAFCDGEKKHLLTRSSDYRNADGGAEAQPPVGKHCLAEGANYPPHALLALAHALERPSGREGSKASRWGLLSGKIDVIAYNCLVLRHPVLTLPRPQFFARP